MDFYPISDQRAQSVGADRYLQTMPQLRKNSTLNRMKIAAAPASVIASGGATLTSIRQNMNHGIALLNAELPPIPHSIFQYTYGFASINECECYPVLARTTDAPNGRLKVEQHICDTAKQLQNSAQTPHIVGIGTGGLGQEVQLIRSLLSSGIRNFKLDLVDLAYKDSPPQNHAGIEDSNKKFLAEEFVELITTGLGAKFTMGSKKAESCGILSQHLQFFIAKNNLPTDANIELRVFSSVNDYKANISKASAKKPGTRANIVYDIDLIHDLQEKNTIVSDALNLTEKDAHYVSLNVFTSNTSQVEIETRTKAKGNWSKSTFSSV